MGRRGHCLFGSPQGAFILALAVVLADLRLQGHQLAVHIHVEVPLRHSGLPGPVVERAFGDIKPVAVEVKWTDGTLTADKVLPF